MNIAGLFRFITSRLERRLIFSILPVVIIAFALVLGIVVITELNLLQENILDSQAIELEDHVTEINLLLEGVESDIAFLQKVGNSVALGTALNDGNNVEIAAQRRTTEQLFLSLVQSNELYKSIQYLDVNGEEVIHVSSEILDDGEKSVFLVRNLTDQSGAGYFQNAMGLGLTDQSYATNVTLTPDKLERNIIEPVMSYSRPVFRVDVGTAQRRPIAAIVITLYAEAILDTVAADAAGVESFLATVPDGQTEAYLIRNTGNPEQEWGFVPGINDLVVQSAENASPLNYIGNDATLGNFVGEETATRTLNIGSGTTQEFIQSRQDDRLSVTYTAYTPPGASYSWVVGTIVNETVLFQPVNQALQFALVVAFGAIVTVSVFIYLLARQIARPIALVSESAGQIAAGQYTQLIEGIDANRVDEIGELNRAFQSMATQLQQFVGGLEARVAARTADLETASEIAAAAARIQDFDDLISLTVNLIRDRFDFYYVQVYLIDSTGENAVLKDGTGFVGRQLLSQGHSLPLDGTSLVALAVQTQHYVLVEDTLTDPNFLPNTLLPQTRTELVIPLRTGDTLIGVLDIQHDKPHTFDSESLILFTTMAEQLSVTAQNVQLLSDSTRRASEMETVAEVSVQASTSIDLSTLLRTITRLTRRNFGLYHVHIYLLNEAGDKLVLAAGSGEAGAIMMEEGHEIDYEHPDSIVAQAARTRENLVINDVRTSPAFLPNPHLPDTQSEMALPILYGGELLGVLDIQDSETHQFDDLTIQVQATLANQIAVAIVNNRTFEQSDSNRRFLNSITDALPDWIFAKDLNFRFLFVNQSFAHAMGHQPEDFIGKDDLEMGFPEEQVLGNPEKGIIGFRNDDMKVIQTGEEVRTPGEPATTADGSIIILDTSKLPLYGADNKIIGVLGIARDVTERQQIQDQIARRAEEANTIAQISSDIAAQLDLENLLWTVVNATRESLKHYHAQIYLLDEPGKRLVLAAGAGEVGQQMVETGHQIALDVDSLVARAARDRQPVLVSNVFTQPDYLPSPDLPKTRGELAIPLLYGDELLGVLDIHDNIVYEYSSVEIQIRQTLANQVATAIKNASVFEEVARRAEESNIITKISTDITAQLDMEELLWRVADATKEEFNRYHAHIYLLSEDGKSLALTAGAGETGRRMVSDGHRIPIDADSVVASAARSHQPVVVPDVYAGSGFLPNPYLPLTQSELAVPLLYGGELLGVLDVQDDKTNQFSQVEIQTQLTLANQIATAIKNAQSFQNLETSQAQLAENEERLNLALEGSSDGLWDWDLISNEVYYSPRWKSILGYHDHELANELDTWQNLMHPDDAENAHANVEVHLNDPIGTPYEVEFRMQHKDGSWRWILARGTARTDNTGKPVRFVGTHSDITIRKDADEEREILLNVAQQLSNASSADDVLGAVQQYGAAIGANSASLMYITHDDNGKPEALVTAGNWNADDTPPAVPVGARYLLEHFTISKLWMSKPNTVSFFNDTQTDSRVDPASQQMYAQLGVHGAAILPLYYQRRWIGMIALNWQEPVNFTDRDVRIFTELMRQATPQVDAIRTAEEVELARQRAETLAYLTTQLSQTNDEADILMVLASYMEHMRPDQISLAYVETNEMNIPVIADMVTVWESGHIRSDHALVGQRLQIQELPFSYLWIANPYEPLVVNDMQTDERFDEKSRQAMQDMGVAASIVLPQYSAGRWQSTITMNWAIPHEFTEEDIYIFDNLLASLGAVVASRRDFLASQRASEEANLLYTMNSQINEAQNEHELLDAIISKTIIPEASSISMALFDEIGTGTISSLTVVADWNRDGDSLAGVTIPLEQMPFISHFSPDRLNVNEDIHNSDLDELSIATLEALNIFAYICIPLIIQNRWLGLVNFYSDAPTIYTASQHRVLQTIGQQLSSAMERLNLLQQTRRRAAELETVARVSTATTTVTDVNALLQNVVDLTRSSFELYHAHIYLLNEDTNQLELAAGSGEAGTFMKNQGHAIPYDRQNSLVARAARSRNGVVSNDIMDDRDFMPNPYLPDTRSEMAIPMVVGDTLIGVLDLQSTEIGRFTDEDVRVKTTLADQVAVAVQNAMAFERERRTVERLKEVDRLKQEFLANMSHELRTPLNSIIGYSEVLLDGVDGELTEDAIEDVDAIYTSGKHLLNIINEILDLAKIEAGQMQLHTRELDIVAILKDIVRSSQILVKDKDVDLNLIEDSPVYPINGDKVRLNQVMLNLVSNAIKFTEEGSVTIRYGMENEDMLYVRIEDTGIGMTPEDLAVIFERFRQADGSSTRRAGGTGLGLTITRQLIQMHGGDVFVDSAYGRGSVFWFVIPIIKDEPAPENGSAETVTQTVEDPA